LEKRAALGFQEAKDNVRHLEVVKELCEAVYSTEPPDVTPHLHSILYSIRAMVSASKFYNKPDRVMALLLFLTNQIVIQFKGYLNRIWYYPKREAIDRIKVSSYAKYYYCVFYGTLTIGVSTNLS